MKSYTPLRRFYAWVGFATIVVIVLAVLAFLLSKVMYPDGKTLLISPQAAMAAENQKVQIAAVVTAYSSSVDETDATPNINAAGLRPHEGSIACPAKYAFGTTIIIEGKQYQCDDRMAQSLRDKPHFDIWVSSKKEAFGFGKQLAIVTIQKP